MRKNVACTITYTAWDTDANAPKTGDVAQHTMRIIADGTAGAITATPVEVENGEYKIVVAADENTGVAMTLEGASSTTYIEIIPVKWTNEVGADATRINGVEANAVNLASACSNYSVTRGLTGTALPAVVAGANGGVPLGDASARVDVGSINGDADAPDKLIAYLETEERYWYPVGTINAAGDLCYMDSDGNIQAASEQSDQGSEPSNQEAFARNFVGVVDNSLNGFALVASSCIRTFSCPSDTYAVGQLVGPDETGGTTLMGTTVAKVSDRRYAIGVVAVAVTVADTSVEVKLFGRAPTIDWEDGRRLDTLLDDVPTTAEFNARSLVTAEYATVAGQTTIAGYTDTLETLGATIAGYTDTLETSATTIAGYTDSLETAVATLQTTANSILTDTGTTLHQFVDEVESLLKNVTYGLAALKAALDTIPSIAAGGTSTIIECQVGGSPVDGVEVWMTTDEAGANVVHGTFVSNAFGLADFGAIDSGTYFVWRQLAGYNFENPEEITVS